MIKYFVDLGDRSYDINIGAGLINELGEEVCRREVSSVLIVTNTTVGQLYLHRAQESIRRVLPQIAVNAVRLPDGECYKDLEHIQMILDAAQAANLDRRSLIVALGGGVVGDMAGFAASMWMRGIRFIQVPTTLLSQVDSSVGGKTGVNLPAGKNLIGAFYQPACVMIDTEVLKSLPQREISAGLAEVIKYGFLGDAEFVRFVEENINEIRHLNLVVLEKVIAHCCKMKAEIVREDEREGGVRALLNFGHTFAHAIEKLTGYGTWLHGEAVGVGMVMAADLSMRLGYLSIEDVERVRLLVKNCGLPDEIRGLKSEEVLTAMRADKKAVAGELRFVVMSKVGKTHVQRLSAKDLQETMQIFGW